MIDPIKEAHKVNADALRLDTSLITQQQRTIQTANEIQDQMCRQRKHLERNLLKVPDAIML